MPVIKKVAVNPLPNLDPRKGTFTALELAEFLGISRANVWRLNAAGKIPRPVKLNRSVRWDRWVMMEWLAAGGPPRDQWESRNPK